MYSVSKTCAHLEAHALDGRMDELIEIVQGSSVEEVSIFVYTISKYFTSHFISFDDTQVVHVLGNGDLPFGSRVRVRKDLQLISDRFAAAVIDAAKDNFVANDASDGDMKDFSGHEDCSDKRCDAQQG